MDSLKKVRNIFRSPALSAIRALAFCDYTLHIGNGRMTKL